MDPTTIPMTMVAPTTTAAMEVLLTLLLTDTLTLTLPTSKAMCCPLLLCISTGIVKICS